MRKQFVRTIDELLETDDKLVLFLGDIGVFGFRNALSKFPERVYNIGILEQSTVGLAAGLSMQGFVPVVHTIAPFIVERALEQIKNDFGYQRLGGNFVSVGASYDYSALGSTHHCPADVGILKNVPEIEIVLPGTAAEFDSLFKQSYKNGQPTYFRLSEKSNSNSEDVVFGKANVIKKGRIATVIAAGTMLDRVKEACRDMDVTILYYTTLHPFDGETLRNNICGDKIVICEPYYSGALALDVAEAVAGRKVETLFIGVPREFLRNYGTESEQDEFLKLTPDGIKRRIGKFIN